MLMYTAKRLLAGIVTVWFIATATFIAMHAVPGDPLMNDKAVSPEIRANLERKYGLDKSATEQYVIFMTNMLKGDFGISFTQQNRQVNEHHPRPLSCLSHPRRTGDFIRCTRGRAVGALTAIYRNRLPDIIIMFLVILGISVPSFVFAAIGQLFLVNLNSLVGFSIIPVAGWGTFHAHAHAINGPRSWHHGTANPLDAFIHVGSR